MSTLANHAFMKMNGLGNEIVVVDMRGQAGAITADEARAAAQPDGAPYDQLMALHTARTPGTDAYVRIYNSDGSEAGACGNGMRCIAELLFKETGRPTLTFETKAGLLDCWKDDAPGLSTVDMGAPRFAWHEIPLAAAVDDTRAIDLQIGPAGKPILRAPSVVSMGNPHADFLGRRRQRLRPGEARAAVGARSDLSRAGEYFIGAGGVARAHRVAHLGAWRRSHPGVRIGRLRGGGRRGAPRSRRPRGDGDAAGRRPADRWRERDDHVLMTGPVEFEYEGKFAPALFAAAGAA